jgi:hypothetical protein
MKPEKIEEREEIPSSVMTALKKGTRDRNRALKTISFTCLFKLLESFSQDRNAFAPIVYKTLTFLTVENHSD